MEKKYPFYFRSTVTLFGIILFVYMLFMLKGILIPLAFSLMIAILLNPLVNKLQQKKIPKIPAIIIALLLTILFIAGLMVFISSQIVKFSDNMPVLQQKFSELFSHLQVWLQKNYSFILRQTKTNALRSRQ